PDARKYFKGVDIKGGVAITLRDETENFGAIGTFIPFEELKSIHKKIYSSNKDFRSINEIIFTTGIFHFTEAFSINNPATAKILKSNSVDFLTTNIFEKLPKNFLNAVPNDGYEYVQIYGLLNMHRVYKWIRRDYITEHETLDKFKVFLPKSNGSGEFGEELSNPVIGEPNQGCTQTFITVGAFDTRDEAEACLKYIKSKFARCMLGILKVTQHNPPSTWAKVPLQDFTSASDIDWSLDVDAQLYRKYNLSETEIKFIETHVKAMS
ncbi:MAG: restriction endonuclease, partial [Selenomonadaceae bacterium]|nr:restriction endonuclease [Selenomonadaceae bacterium]